MQVGAALACAAECIATRNARDFRKSPIPAVTPARQGDLMLAGLAGLLRVP